MFLLKILRMKTLIILLSLFSTSLFAQSWPQYLRSQVLKGQGWNKFFPDVQYLKGWENNRDYVYEDDFTPQDIQPIAHSCRSPYLYPTHPGQYGKKYHFAVMAAYNYAKLPPTSEACVTPNPTKKFCLRATWANVVVMSDTFKDSCGGVYRGYWLTTFLSNNESMGTLNSAGRTYYPKPNTIGEVMLGGTFRVEAKKFFALGELLPGDEAIIQKDVRSALKAGFKVKNHLFIAP